MLSTGIRAIRTKGTTSTTCSRKSSSSPKCSSAPSSVQAQTVIGQRTRYQCVYAGVPKVTNSATSVQYSATEITSRMAYGVPQADGRVAAEPTFDPEHVARAVLFMAELPLDTNVQFLTITATKMPFIGRG